MIHSHLNNSTSDRKSRPYFLDIFDIFPRCASTLKGSQRLLWMHPHYEKGFTWDASRIELLWDSILRGLPIGSFTTCAGPDRVCPIRRYDDLLLDGEQRCLAIALGMHEPEFESLIQDPDYILWIDLNPVIPPYSDREFMIRLTTADHPWGFGKSDDCPTLSPELMRESLSYNGLNADDADYTHKRPRPRDLFPYEASVPIPLGWLLKEKGKEFEVFWEAIEDRTLASGINLLDSVTEFLRNRSRAAQKTRQKIYTAVSLLNRYRIISIFLPDSISSNGKFLDSHLRRLNPVSDEAGFFLKFTALHPGLREKIRRMSKRRMPPERLFALAIASVQGGDLILNPTDLSSLKSYLEESPDNIKEIEKFVSEELEVRLERTAKLLLYDPLTSPRGILLAHLTMIARERPSIYAFLLATDWTQEDEIDLLILGNPERNELIKAVSSIAWFAEAVPATIRVFQESTRIDLFDYHVADCEKQKLLPTLSNPKDVYEFTSKNPSIGFELLLYAQRDYISRHFPSYDPSRPDHWLGQNLPWTFDSLIVRSKLQGDTVDWDKFLDELDTSVGHLRACPPEALQTCRTNRITNPYSMAQAFLNEDEAEELSVITGTKDNLEKCLIALHRRSLRIYAEWLGEE